MGIQDREHLEVTSAKELWEWLSKNHSSSPGLWLVTNKKASGKPAPTYDEIVRTVLCWGWIDSITGKVSEHQSKLYLSPRKPTSAWSQSNKSRVEELIASGQMTSFGLAKIDDAKRSGKWSLIDSAQNAEIPDDLESAFAEFPGSHDNFQSFPKGVRKQILEWIAQAKTASTRDKRIRETASLAEKNIRANQWRDKRKTQLGQ